MAVVVIFPNEIHVDLGVEYHYQLDIHLRLERGGELVIGASCTKTDISRLIYKISRHMIHQKIAYSEAF